MNYGLTAEEVVWGSKELKEIRKMPLLKEVNERLKTYTLRQLRVFRIVSGLDRAKSLMAG